LAQTFLNVAIQTDREQGHDSAQDAITALHLWQLKVAQGLGFGLPPLPYTSMAYDTLLTKVKAPLHAMEIIMARSSTVARCDDGHDETKVHDLVRQTRQRPWSMYANGNLGDAVASGLTQLRSVDPAFVQTVYHAAVEEDVPFFPTRDGVGLTWLEMDFCTHFAADPKVYMDTFHVWQRQQQEAIVALDKHLTRVFAKLPPQTLLMVLPQVYIYIYIIIHLHILV
jgi:hypothetical protein